MLTNGASCRATFLTATLAMAATLCLAENIDSSSTSRFAWSENAGWIDAEPLGDGGPGVHVGDFALTGWMWGENFGWISLSCENTGSCATVEYGVRNTCDGALSGFGWGENVGWVNLDPMGAGVTVDTDAGRFSGYAWFENLGWASFDCSNTEGCESVAYGVETSWRPSTQIPEDVVKLRFDRAHDIDYVLSWSGLPQGLAYDVVRGSLAVLRSTGGGYSNATQECIADSRPWTSLVVTSIGEDSWFLVRGESCGGTGTYDCGGQVAPRDPGIAASGQDCPVMSTTPK